MKKQFILFFIFFYSIVSFGQLDSVISEIIGTKPGFNSYSENPITDSLFNLHFNSIIEIASQKDLETILDSTNSIDFKYCIFRILINYPSDKISDVFFDVLMDKNGGETFSSHWCYASYMRTWETMEDTQSSQKLKEVLARELIEMDSIWFFYKHKAPHYPYDDEMGEYQFVQKRNRQYKNQKVARWILKDYFKNTIKDFGDKTYGNWCG